jgi:hypothetical protein
LRLKKILVFLNKIELFLEKPLTEWGLIRIIYKCVQEVFGGLAQLGEHLPYKQEVTGSSPVSPIEKQFSMVLS